MTNGFLVIADLSGYTAFLSHAELEPAAEHLRRLLDILIDNTRPPLHVSKLEGDAVLSYALAGSFLQGQTLMEMIEATYVAFRQALEQLVLNSRCDCTACEFVPDLDLKFFVHYGAFLLQPLANGQTELVGSDVNLIHRLTKNHIVASTGRSAYVAYTEAAVHHLGLEDWARQMPFVVETYDHVGEVLVFVQDMHEVWARKQPELQLAVADGEALARFEALLPASQILLWDHITLPDNGLLFSDAAGQPLAGAGQGRIGAGSTYECVDGHPSQHTIRAWEPPRQYTYESERPLGAHGRTTIRLEASGDDTRLTVLVGKSAGGREAMRRVLDPLYRRASGRQVKAWLARLDETVAAGQAAPAP